MRKLRQVLPSVRMIANLRGPEKNPDLSETARQRLVDERKAWEDRLTDLAAKAHQRRHGPFEEEPLSVMFAPVRARRAIEFYISEKAYETGLPHLRKILKAANKFSTKAPSEAIVRFCRLAGTTSDAVPPFAQMRALFCYGDPSSNGLESNDADEIRRHQEREDIWTASLSPAVLLNGITKVGQEALGEALAQWLALTRELHEMTGKGRSPIAAEINFVAALAHYWRHEVKAVMGNSRSKNYCSDEPWRQRGLFADFVRASAELIPPEYRPHSWDRAIRSVLQQSP